MAGMKGKKSFFFCFVTFMNCSMHFAARLLPLNRVLGLPVNKREVYNMKPFHCCISKTLSVRSRSVSFSNLRNWFILGIQYILIILAFSNDYHSIPLRDDSHLRFTEKHEGPAFKPQGFLLTRLYLRNPVKKVPYLISLSPGVLYNPETVSLNPDQ